jgi:hypothetical protein
MYRRGFGPAYAPRVWFGLNLSVAGRLQMNFVAYLGFFRNNPISSDLAVEVVTLAENIGNG